MAESFDIVSNVDFAEVKNAVMQAGRETATRYDLKKANVSMEMEGEEITLESSDDFTLEQALVVLQTKLTRRGVDLKSTRYGKVEPASGGRARQKITFQQGIPQETSKKIVADIKKMKAKCQASIQGDTVRVSSKKRDVLQEVIAHLKSGDFDVPITFNNFRSS